jgi:YegS/Rv2252/BmrU family lipid kinase
VRALVIVNPVAGNGRAARVWQQVRADVDGLRHSECVLSERVGHARELAQSAAQAGCERVVVVGGDGTMCEVASGVAHTQTAVAMIPAGTGNDCCRNLGIPSDARAAANLALDGPVRAVDLGEIFTAEGSTHFVNVAGFGFDAEVAWRVNAVPKFVGGTVPYVWGVLQTLWHYNAPRMRINLDDHELEQPVYLVAVGIGACYGGGMRIVPDAIVDDGLFDVCVVGNLSRLEVLRLFPKIYSGAHRGHAAVQFFRCRDVRAESLSPARCQADGEQAGDLPASFKIHPGGLQCVTSPRR